MLAAGAMVASLLAVGAAPAAALDDKSEPDILAATSACVGDAATHDAGFTDTDGLGAESAINCLAYYGITAGKTADMFDPNSNVTRSQMALFLHRAAGLMGLELEGGDTKADFDDIADLGEDRQNAVKDLARNGILSGRGAMTFAPSSDITRAEMAVALVNLVDKVTPKVTKTKTGTYTLVGPSPAADVFADAYATMPATVNGAISAIYELGITTGYQDGTFRPSASVPRRHMAAFITRALAHSKAARPAGVTAQRERGGKDILVSVRDADFVPVVNAVVDAFSYNTAAASKAFKTDGTCSSRFGVPVEDGAVKCAIDRNDPATDSSGDVPFSPGPVAKDGTTVWVWTGESGDKVTTSTDLFELELEQTATTAAEATTAVVSTGFNPSKSDDFRARFGSEVNYTIQLQAEDVDHDGNDATPPQSVDAKPDKEGDAYELKVIYPNGKADIEKLTIDKNGKGEFTLSLADPNPAEVGQTSDLNFELRPLKSGETNAGDLAPTITGAEDDGIYRRKVDFSDEKSKVFAVSVKAGNAYSEAPTGDATSSGNSVVVTVTDQYGSPMRGISIVAESDKQPKSEIPSRARYTRSNGEVRISYTYTGDATPEVITAIWDGDTADESDDTGCKPDGMDVCGSVTVHWYTKVTNLPDMTRAADAEDRDVVHADIEANEIVVDKIKPMLVAYDSNDQFESEEVPVSMADFEAALTKGLDAQAKAVATSGAGPDDIPAVTLSWNSYNSGDDSAIARWSLSVIE